MNRAAFRKFDFFEFDVITQNLSSAIGGVPTCAVAESGLLIFGDELGNIIFADRDLKVSERKHKIFNGEVLGLAYVLDTANQNRQYIVALGDDARPTYDATAAYNASPVSATPVYIIKVFSITDFQHPVQVINATVNDGLVTSFAVHSEGLEVAVGYSNGKVLVFTNVVSRDSQGRAQTPTVLLTNHFAGVSNLFFCESNSKSSEMKRIKLFVVMDTRDSQVDTAGQMNDLDQDDIEHAGIIVFDVSLSLLPNKSTYVISPRQSPKALDDKGASKFNACFFKATSELVVARNEALYTYTVEDKGGATAMFGDKMCLHCVGRYTLIVSMEEKNTAVTGDGNTSGMTSNKARRAMINIYDTKNRFICFSSKKQFPANDKVAMVMSDAGVLYLVTGNGTLLRYKEKDAHSKLKVLLEQSEQPLYSLAITLAAEEQLEATEIMKLYKQYGDHLYSKHEFDAAITQYCHTIGYIPPSYVIIKFLDPYRINNLVTYLEKIKDRGIAAANHITLLISCYAKLKEEEKITALLESIYDQTKQLFANNPQQQEGHSHSSHSASRALDIVNNFRAWALAGGNAQTGAGQGLGNNNNTNNVMMLSPAGGAGTGLKANDLHLQHFQQQQKQQIHPHALFDPIQAIQILQSAGYNDLAARVALRYGQHDSYLKIQMSKEPPKYDEVLGYLAYLSFIAPPEDVTHLLLQFGPGLMAAKPRAFTQLLIRLCSNTLDVLLSFEQFQQATVATTATTAAANSTGGVAVNPPIGSASVSSSKKLVSSQVGMTAPGKTNSNNNNLLTLASDMPSFPTLLRMLQGLLECRFSAPTDYYLSLNDVLPLFADRSEYLFLLLDGVVQATKNRLLSPKLWTTLLELYMQQYHLVKTQPAVKAIGGVPSVPTGNINGTGTSTALSSMALEQLEQKIMNILDAPQVSYDAAHVLLLCHIFGFDRGARFLLEKQNFIELVLLQMMSGRRSREMYKLLRKEGTKDPELFVQVLKFLVQQTMAGSVATPRHKKNKAIKSGRNDDDDEEEEEDEEKRVERALNRGEYHSDIEDDTEAGGSDTEENDDDDNEAKWDLIKDLVDLIEKEGILSPIQVLSILSLNPELPLHVVADFVQNTFQELSESVQSIDMDVKEAKRKLDQVTHVSVAELEMKKRQSLLKKEQAGGVVSSTGAGHRRQSTGMNGRSFNPYEEDEDDEEDEEDEEEKLRQLRAEAEKWQTIREQLIRTSKDHETFFKELEQSPDGFSIVAGFFGRSLIFYE